MNYFEIEKRDKVTNARVGILKTPHGEVRTPSYVVVGTDAAVRCVPPEELPRTKTQLIIANTYHLWRTLGLSQKPAERAGSPKRFLKENVLGERLETFEGLHKRMKWNGALMTDSGGFQVFSFGFGREHGLGKMMPRSFASGARSFKMGENLVRITEDGVYFIDKEEESYLDAETSIHIQEKLGADIIVAFDEPTSPLHDHIYTEESLVRTHAWALRSLKARTRGDQLMYGVVQGGAFEDLRRRSAEFIGKQQFEGFAIGGSYGESMGAPREQMLSVMKWSVPYLPEEKPRHLLGIGRIEDVFDAVELGMDTFDCVIPTREARHGSIWTALGRVDIKKGIFNGSDAPLEEGCGCIACAEKKTTRGALRELFKSKDLEAGHLATLHNVYFFNNLLEKIRSSILEGRFSEFKGKFLCELADACG